MPLFLDVHHIEGITPEDVASAHLLDLAVQEKHGVKYMKYWFNEQAGTLFCFVDARDREAASAVHREAHGFIAEAIIEVGEALIDGFLGGGEATPLGAALASGRGSSALDGGLRTILFTDLVDSTSVANRVGDARAVEILRIHDAIVRQCLGAAGGREVKHTGDGLMASFVSASDSVRCAIDIQRAFARHNQQHGETLISVRIGFSAGEPVANNEDLFGAAVNLAARVCAHAQAGQILVSNVIPELCIAKGFEFTDQGEVMLKGFDEAVRLHEVVWSGGPP